MPLIKSTERESTAVNTRAPTTARAIVLLPIRSLIETMLASQTLNGVLLPIILITMLKLINDKRLMGEYVNGRVFNVIAWAMVIALIALTTILVITSVLPGVFSG